MKPNEPSPQGGFSLIELLIVLVLLSIISTFALLAFGSSKVDLNRQAVVREFKIYLERARFDSVKRRAEDPNQASVTLNDATSFTVRLDYNEDGTLQPGETRTVDFSQRSNTQILVTDTLNYPVTISFNRRGHVTTIDGSDNEINPIFTVCTNCDDASPANSVISLSTTGTVSISSDQPDPSALPTPVVTNANVTPNCYIYIANANANGSVTCRLE